MCDNMQFSAEGGLELEYSRYMGEWFKVQSYNGRPLYQCPGIDCQGLDHVMGFIDGQGWTLSIIFYSTCLFVGILSPKITDSVKLQHYKKAQ